MDTPRAQPKQAIFGAGCLLGLTLFAIIPLAMFFAWMEWFWMGIGLVVLYVILLFAEPLRLLQRLFFFLPALLMLWWYIGEEALDLADDWSRQRQRDQAQSEMTAFYQQHYPSAMRARDELEQKLLQGEAQLAKMRAISAPTVEQQQVLEDSRKTLRARLDTLIDARNRLDTELMRLYLRSLQDESFGQSVSQDITETVNQVQDVLHSLKDLNAE